MFETILWFFLIFSVALNMLLFKELKKENETNNFIETILDKWVSDEVCEKRKYKTLFNKQKQNENTEQD